MFSVCLCASASAQRGRLEPGGLRPYLVRFLCWVVKVTYGASSRVQGLGEKMWPCPPLPLVSCSSHFSLRPATHHRVRSGKGRAKGNILSALQMVKGLGCGLDGIADLT